MNELNFCPNTFSKDHDFIKTKEGNDMPIYIICAYCGQVRQLYLDGTIEILKDIGTVKWELTIKA